jgi:photosystem II stability/assembly factor-like uncharacterized protein
VPATSAAASSTAPAASPTRLIPSKSVTRPPDAPPGDRIVDVDLHDDRDSWALLSVPCAAGRCAQLSRSADDGRHWQRLPTTAVRTLADGLFCTDRCFVSHVRFVSAEDGYLYGPGFASTSDGGRTWTTVPGLGVDDIAKVGSTVLRIAEPAYDCACNGDPGVHLQYLAHAGVWVRAAGPIGSGNQPWGQFAVAGTVAYALFSPNFAAGVINSATILRSSDLGRTWQATDDPCATVATMEAAEMAATAGRVVVLCGSHGGDLAPQLHESSDGGLTFGAAVSLPFPWPGELSITADRVFLEGTDNGGQPADKLDLDVSRDGGRTWSIVRTEEVRHFNDLESNAVLVATTTGTVGWVVDPFALVLSHDDGATWTKVAAAAL